MTASLFFIPGRSGEPHRRTGARCVLPSPRPGARLGCGVPPRWALGEIRTCGRSPLRAPQLRAGSRDPARAPADAAPQMPGARRSSDGRLERRRVPNASTPAQPPPPRGLSESGTSSSAARRDGGGERPPPPGSSSSSSSSSARPAQRALAAAPGPRLPPTPPRPAAARLRGVGGSRAAAFAARARGRRLLIPRSAPERRAGAAVAAPQPGAGRLRPLSAPCPASGGRLG